MEVTIKTINGTSCPNCNQKLKFKEIKAESCPHCNQRFAQSKGVKVFTWIFILIIVMLLFSSIRSCSSDRKGSVFWQLAGGSSEAEKAEEAQALETLPSYTSRELAEAYESNAVAADQKFKGKRFKVSGKVTNISTDFLGRPYLTMQGLNQFMEPQFSFAKSALDQIARINKGMTLTLVCEGNGDIAKTPMSSNCQILEPAQ